MKHIIWLTDPHLNFAAEERIRRLLGEVRDARPDVVLVGGDIGEAKSFVGYLRRLAGDAGAPVYFVLGNHDYYRGSIAEVRNIARSLGREPDSPVWLPEAAVVSLSRRTALVGHGGWGDGRAGDFLASEVVLNDYLLIEELRDCHRSPIPQAENILTPALLKKLQELGDEAADHFRVHVPEALRSHDHVLVLTHVPPFREACWHEGRLSDDDWAPHFTCRAAGDVLAECMRPDPGKRMTVLCGHTHSPGRAQILENLEVLTGAARYGEPQIQEVLAVE